MDKLGRRKRHKKYQAITDYYIREGKKPSIRKGQKWIVDGLLFSEYDEQTGFCSTWICKRLGTEVYLHKKEVIETFGIEALNSISMQIDIS